MVRRKSVMMIGIATVVLAATLAIALPGYSTAAEDGVGHLEITAALNAKWRDAAVHRGYLYQAGAGVITVFDATDPDRVRPVGRAVLDPTEDVWHLAVEGDTLFATSGDALWAVDIRDPRQPEARVLYRTRIAGRWTGPRLRAVAVADGFAYLASQGGMQIVDVRDLAAPRPMGLLSFPRGDDSDVPWVGAIAAEGGRVVVITHNETQDEVDYRVLHAVDVSDYMRPRIQASSVLRYLYLEYDPDPVEVVLAGDTAIIAQQGGLWSADIADPAGIQWVSELPLTQPVTHLARSGDRVYTSQADGSVHAYDALEPRALREIGVIQGWAPNHYMDVFAVSNGLILAAREEGELHLIRDSETGDLVKSPTTHLPSGASDLAVADGRAYLATGRGLSILDVTDSGSPQLLGWTRAVSGALAVEGRLLYSFDRLGGLRVVDVGNPAAVVEIGRLTDVGDRTDRSGSGPAQIEVRGNLALIGINGGRVSVVDVSQPAAPRLRGVVSTQDGGYPYGMTASGTHVYATISGLEPHWHVIDIRDPDAPRLVETRSRPDTYPFGIAVAGGRLYVTSRMEDDSDRSLLEIFELADPAHPALIGETPLPDNTDSSVAIDGTLAYAGGIAGIAVVDVSDPSKPRVVNPGLALAWAGRPGLFHVASLWGWDARPVVATEGYVYAGGLTIARFRTGLTPSRCYLPLVGGPARN